VFSIPTPAKARGIKKHNSLDKNRITSQNMADPVIIYLISDIHVSTCIYYLFIDYLFFFSIHLYIFFIDASILFIYINYVINSSIYIFIYLFIHLFIHLCIHLFIHLSVFRQLRCDRITIHKNLFISYLLTDIFCLVYLCVLHLSEHVVLHNPVRVSDHVH
jgi:hypothetical protein